MSTHHRLLVIASLVAVAGCASSSNPEPEPTTVTGTEAIWTNGDFEGDPIGTAPPTGWTVTTNLNPGITDTRPASQTLASLNLGSGGIAVTAVVGGSPPESQLDPDIGSNGTLRYPKYGQRAARLNYGTASNGSNKNVNSMTQSMTVGLGDVDPTDNKVHVRFAIAAILENPNHTYTEQPYYFVRLQNNTKSLTLYSDFNASGQPGVPWKNFTDLAGNAAQYTDWQLVDVSPGDAQLAVGDNVTLTIIAAGCSQGGHWGRVYVDAVGSGIPGLYTWATGPQVANAGTAITYTVNYKNGGTTTTSGTAIDLTTPPNTTYKSTTGASCTAPAQGSTGTVRCQLGTLAPGATGSYTVTVNIPAGTATGTVITNGTYQIYATGVSALIGPKVNTTVTSGASYADLGVTLTDGYAAVAWGTSTTYTMVVNNAGPVASTATVTDTMPSQLANVTWSCAATGSGSCTASGSGSISDNVSLPVGATLTYTINANVVAGSGSGSVIDQASVATSGATTDPSSANNTAVDTDSIGTLRTLTITKQGLATAGSLTSEPAAISCGTGCTSATGQFLDGSQVVLTAAPITGATFIGWGGACAASGTSPSCTLAMAGDQSVTASYAGAPAITSMSTGSPQSATVSRAFAQPLAVLVTDASGNAVPGATVTFAAPSTGATASLSATTAVTNASGIAQITATAGSVAGAYTVTGSISGITPVASFALANIGAPASVVVSSGSPQSATVGTAFANPLVALVRDAANQPISGVTVSFGAPATGASASLSSATAVTDASGLASISATAGTVAGTYDVSAVVGALTAATFALTNTAGGPATLAVTGGSPQSATVGAAFASALTVELTDAYHNPISGATVTFAAPATGASATVAATATTNASGLASTTAAANTVTGAYTITATFGALSPASFSLTNTAGPPATITAIGGGGQSTTVNTAFAQTLRAAVADQYGNPVPNVLVLFSAPAAGASAAVANATTDASGIATSAATANTKAGAYAVTAHVAVIPTPASFALANTAGAAATVTISGGNSQTTTVGAAFATPLAVTVTDAFGNPVAGATVTLASPSTGASAAPNPLVVTTDASGVASGTLTANFTAGTYAVTAAVAGTTGATFSESNAPGAAAAIAIAGGNSQHATVATAFAAPLAVTVTDAHGNAVPNASVTFGGPGAGAGATFSPSTATTNASGVAQTTATANNTAGGYTVTAAIGGANVPFSLTNDPGAPAAIAVSSGTSQSTAVDTAFGAPLVARVTDSKGNAVPNATVTFAAPSSGASASLSTATATTSASGVASVTATANTKAGAYDVTATVGAVAPASFALTNTAGAVATLTASGGGGQSAVVLMPFGQPLAIHAADQYGNAVPSATIAFAAPGSGATATVAPTATTDATGDAQVSATAGAVAGSYSVTATSGSATAATFALTNLPGAPAQIAVLDGNDQSATVATAFGAPLRAIVTDAQGNAVAGTTVTFVPDVAPASATVASPTAVTDATGAAAMMATANTKAGAYSVTASIAAGASTSFSLTNTAGAPASIAIVGTSSPQTATVLEPFAEPLAVLVEDEFGNPAPGAAVTFAPPDSGATAALESTTATTGSDGTGAVGATAGAIAGSYIVHASVSGVPDAAAFALTNTAGAAATLAVTGGDSQSATVDTDFASLLSALVLDANGNPVPNVVVSFTPPVTPATATLAASSALTDATGTATMHAHAGTVSGSYQVIAQLPGGAAPVAFSLTNTAGAAVAIAASEASTPQQAQVGTTFVAPLVAIVSDGFGNGVPSVTVTFAAPASGATAGLGSASATTGADGRASLTAVAGTTAGAYAVTASATGVTSPATFALTNLPGPAQTITIVSGANQQATVALAFGAPLVALVQDADGNAVPDAAVTFGAPGSGASATLDTTSTFTGSDGTAATTLTANTVAGAYAVTATAEGGAAPVAFALTNVAGAPASASALASASPQTTQVLEPFGNPLALIVTDPYGNRVPGVDVEFSVPSLPGATLSSASATTDATGIAQVFAIADSKAGAYTATAAVAGTAGVTFALANTSSSPSDVLVTSGGMQHALATQPFAQPFAVRVLDGYGNPIANATVTFSAPATGATATVDSGSHVTDANGTTSATLVAGPVVGSFVLAAQVQGATTAGTTTLFVDPIPTIAALTGSGSTPVDEQATVTVTLASDHGTPSGSVYVTTGAGTMLGAAALASDGTATITLPALSIGEHDVVAHYAGTGPFGGSTSAPLALVITGDSGSLSGGGCAAAGGGGGWLAIVAVLAAVLGRRRRTARAVAVAMIAATAGIAAADPTGARALDRFHAAAADSEWFALDSVEFAGSDEIAVAMVDDDARDPLTIYNADGTVRDRVVTDSVVAQLGASVTLADLVRLSATVPVSPWQAGNGGTYNGMPLSSPVFAFGDVSLAGDVRIYGAPHEAFRLAVGVRVVTPSGSRTNFMSDGRFGGEPRVLAAGSLGMFEYAASASALLRGRNELAGESFGSELRYDAAAGVRLVHDRLLVGPELIGATPLERDTAIGTPVELGIGAHYAISRNWRVGLGATDGLVNAIGVPTWRGLASLAWMP